MALKGLLNQLNDLEAPICRSLSQRGDRLGTQRLFALVSRLGDGLFWYLIMLVLPILFGHEGLIAAAHMLGVGLVSLVIYKLLKHFTGRLRPCDQFDDIRRHAPMLDMYSFPSGHTMHAVSFTAVLLAYFPTLGLLVTPFVFLVASSRLILGLHYPSDVIAGALIGGGVAWASLLLVL